MVMATAALLRSVARKLARAPPPSPHPRPLRADGLHGGARSGPGGSFPPPTSNQIRQGSGDRLVVGMAAAAAGLRSGAALPSLATKIARAPPQPHQRLLNRGLSSAPPTSDKDKIIEDLRLRLWRSRAAVGISGIILSGIAIYGYLWVSPAVEKMRDRSLALNKIEDAIRDIIRADDEDEPRRAALAQIIQTAGHMKQQRNGTTEMGTRADKLDEEDVMKVCFDILKEAGAVLDDMRADLKEFRAATGRMPKSAPSEQKEGCGRVGSETVSS